MPTYAKELSEDDADTASSALSMASLKSWRSLRSLERTTAFLDLFNKCVSWGKSGVHEDLIVVFLTTKKNVCPIERKSKDMFKVSRLI